MEVTCPLCSARHTVDLENTRARSRQAVRFRCTTCGHTHSVDLTPPGQPPVGRGARVGSVTALRAVAYVRVDGENFAVSDLATLQRWILEKRVLREDLCSSEGVTWAPLGSRPELQLFFAASDRLDRTSPSAQHALLTMAHASSEDVFADAPLAGVEEEAGWLTDARTEFVPVPEAPVAARVDLTQSLEPLEAAEAEEEYEEGNADRRHLTFSYEPEISPSTQLAASAMATEPVAPATPMRVEFAPADAAWMESDDALPPPPTLKPRPVPRSPGEPPTGPSLPPPGPPRLASLPPPPAEEREGSHTVLWVGVGICGVISVLLLLWAQGLLGPRMTVMGDDDHTWSKPLPSGATIERPATPAETTETVEVRAGDREGTPHADEAGPLPATTPVEGAGAPVSPTPTRDLSPLPPTLGSPPPPAPPAPVVEEPAARPAKTTKPGSTEPPPAPAPPTELVSGSTTTNVAAPKASARAAAQPGWADVEAQRWSDALAHFQAALQADSGNVWAIYGRAYVYEHTGKIDSATRDYCSALKRTRTVELTRELEAGLRRIGASCPE